jgi:heme/copper-type cytochrome/quinol oxidase subunit 2
MNTPDIEKNIKKIDSYTRDYTSEKKEGYLQLTSNNVYLYIFIGVFFLLVIFRPSIIYNTEQTKNKPKFSPKKFILSWIIISGILCFGLVLYNYKKIN